MKTVCIDRITGLLAPGTRLFIPGTSGQPSGLLHAWHENGTVLDGVDVISTFVSAVNDFDLLPEVGRHGSHTVFFPPPRDSRWHGVEAIRRLSLTYFDIDRYLHDAGSIDFALVQVSPPDVDGHCSLGPCAEFADTALHAARVCVAVINANHPGIPGAPTVNINAFDYALKIDAPPFTLPSSAIGDVTESLAQRIADQIHDGDCVQIGISKLAEATLARLAGKRELRFHSGILFDPIRALVESGTIAEKHNAMVCACLAGDKTFYHWAATRDDLALKPVRFTHHPATLASIERLVSVNSAIEVDLYGQCNAETISGRAVSGAGGLPDFAHAAHRSAGGRSIIALPSVSREGKHSRIVARLAPDATVTVTGHNVDLVITEYGVADLRDSTQLERAESLVRIAHPAFREELERQITSLSRKAAICSSE